MGKARPPRPANRLPCSARTAPSGPSLKLNVFDNLAVDSLLEGNFLELLAKSLLLIPHRVEGRQDLVIVSMHVQRLIRTTVQASTVSLELEALSGIVRVLDGWGPLGTVLAELGGGLARR